MCSKYTKPKGSVLIETALVIPLLLTLSFASFEISHFMKHSELLSFLSREGANAGFRECAYLDDSLKLDCLNDSNSVDGADSVFERVSRIVPTSIKSSTDIIITIFSYDSVTRGIKKTTQVGVNGSDVTSNGYRSKFPNSAWTDNTGVVTDISPVNQVNPVIVVCEVFYRQPRLPYNTLFFSGLAREVYEYSIY